MQAHPEPLALFLCSTDTWAILMSPIRAHHLMRATVVTSEVEDNEAQEEDAQSHAADSDDQIAPAHVGGLGAARFDATAASWEIKSTSVWWNQTQGDDGADSDAERLEQRQSREQVSVFGWQEF